MAKIFRRYALYCAASLCAAVVAVGIASASANAAETFKLRMSWTPIVLDIPFYWAMNKGWFKAEGLELDIEDGNGSTNTVNLVGAGNYDAGWANCGSMTIGRGKAGLPLKCVMNPVRLSTIGLALGADNGAKTLKEAEAKGKTRISFTQGSFEGPFMTTFLKAGGVNPANFELLNVDFQSKMQLYLAGETDGVVTAIPFWRSILAKKRPSNYIPFGDLGLVIPDFGIIVRDDDIDGGSRKVASFIKVVARGWQVLLDDPSKVDTGIQMMIAARSKAKLKAATMAIRWKAFSDFFHTPATRGKGKPPGWQAPEDWVQTIKVMIEAGLVKPGANPQDFYSNKFLDAGT